jgi:hypothetical protein
VALDFVVAEPDEATKGPCRNYLVALIVLRTGFGGVNW